MKPYERAKKIHQNLPDNHPKKGFINWWEDEWCNDLSKRAIRRIAKEQIKRDLNE